MIVPWVRGAGTPRGDPATGRAAPQAGRGRGRAPKRRAAAEAERHRRLPSPCI